MLVVQQESFAKDPDSTVEKCEIASCLYHSLSNCCGTLIGEKEYSFFMVCDRKNRGSSQQEKFISGGEPWA
jgi:hypothetical protein